MAHRCVMAGLGPAISIERHEMCRDHRDKPGDDMGGGGASRACVARAPAGLGPAIPAAEAPDGRDHRDKPGDDMGRGPRLKAASPASFPATAARPKSPAMSRIPANDVPPDILDDDAEDETPVAESRLRRRSRSRGLAGVGQGRHRGHPARLVDAAERARRLPHDRCQGRGALHRQGEVAEGARRLLCARPGPFEPPRPHDRRHRLDGVRHHRDRNRGAAPRSEPHQAAAAALQRAPAGRQVAALHPAHRRPRGAAGRQAPRRAQPAGQLFRALRQRLGRQPHHQRAAARLPAALLQRQLLREPHAPLPAVPDQALLRAVHEGDRDPTSTARSSRRRAPSSRASRTP